MRSAIGVQAESTSSWLYQAAESISLVIWEALRSLTSMLASRLPELLAGAIVLVLFWLIAKLLKAVFQRTMRKTRMDVRIRLLISRSIVAFVCLVGAFAALTIIFPSFEFSSLMAGLGLTSVVIGIAARDIVNNVISGILILWQRPFHLGDHIFVGNDQGKVEFIGVRATSLRTDDGELLLIPNGTLYTNAITIREAGENRRMTFTFSLPYSVDLEDAKAIILHAVRSTGSVVTEPRPQVLASGMTPEGISINGAFWLNTSEHNPLGVLDRCLTAVHSALKQNGIVPFESIEPDDETDKSGDSRQRSEIPKKEKDDLLG